MTRNPQTNQHQTTNPAPASNNEKPRKRRVPSRYDILIQCRDEAEQRELFEQLRREGMSLKLLIL